MRVHHRGFALILVLIAIAGTFVLALHGSAIARSTAVEERIVRERIAGERHARAAAAIALKGLMVISSGDRDAAESAATGEPATGSGSGGGDGGGDGNPGVELPPIVRELMRAAGKDIEEGAQNVIDTKTQAQAQAALTGSGRGDAPRTAGFSFLKVVGIPAAPLAITIDEIPYTITLTDALGLVNINTAPPAQLTALFTALELDQSAAASITAQILDWRDADDFVTPYGAEREQYLRLRIEPRNAEFATLDELRYLPDITPDVFDRIRPFLCLSGDGKIHAGSAPPEVLASIPNLSTDQRTRILDLRSAAALTPAAFKAIIPENDPLRELIRVEPTGYIAIHITRADIPGPHYDGIAVVTDRGIEHIALMPR